jgi:hypothetical protein
MQYTGINEFARKMLWYAFSKDEIDNKEFWGAAKEIIKPHISEAKYEIIRRYIDTSSDASHFIDSMSPSQVESKEWLCNILCNFDHIKTVQIYGGWYSSPLIEILTDTLMSNLKWIENIDLDKFVLELSEKIHRERLEAQGTEYWVTNDTVLSPSPRSFDTDLVINTSSEHMPHLKDILENKNYRTIKSVKKLKTPRVPCVFAIQSNNMFHIDDHINCVDSEEELLDNCKFQRVLYKGTLGMPNGYKRFMVIGQL